jgi:ribosomal protein S18 acetylase RimI-like enzyme
MHLTPTTEKATMAATTHTTAAPRIRKASVADVPRIASTLALAFIDDPVFRWAYPDDTRRREVLPGVFSVFTKAFQRHDEIYLAGPAAGAALWAPPGQAPVDEHHADEFNQRLEQAAGADGERFFELAGLVDEHHPPGSYYYLQLLGVQPESQGRGIGSALLAHMLERCDGEGARAYLDATSPHSKRLYERHGFRASGEFAPEGGPPLWPMWREPGA